MVVAMEPLDLLRQAATALLATASAGPPKMGVKL